MKILKDYLLLILKPHTLLVNNIKLYIMPCSICKENGHNRRSCVKPILKNFRFSKPTICNLNIFNFNDSNSNILCVDSWKNSKAFTSIKNKKTQTKYYTENNSCDEIIQLVNLSSVSFGNESEKIIKELFGIKPRSSSQNDGIKYGKKIEIKSARYWQGQDECRWQHLEIEHDYDYVLFTLLDFNGWKVWCVKKHILVGQLKENGILTHQGNQGWWCKKSEMMPYMTPIKTVEEFDKFIQDACV